MAKHNNVLKMISDTITSGDLSDQKKPQYRNINEGRQAGHTTAALDALIMYGAYVIVPSKMRKIILDSLRDRCREYKMSEDFYLIYSKKIFSSPYSLMGIPTDGKIIIFDNHGLFNPWELEMYQEIIRNPRVLITLQH